MIKVSSENANYSNYNEDGILYNKNVTKIICYPCGKTNETYTFPTNVTSIDINAFCNCISLRNIEIPCNITSVGDKAFASCCNLTCVFYYGETVPTNKSDVFDNNNLIRSVMTSDSYIGQTFCGINVSKGTVIDECLPPTQSFTRSNTYSNTFTNTFTQSNTFTKSNTLLPSNVTLTLSLTNSYSITETVTISGTYSYSYVLTLIGVSSTYVRTDLIYYEYILTRYSTLYSFYSNFFTIIDIINPVGNGISQKALIGIICGAIIAVLLIMGIIIFLVKKSKKSNSESTALKLETKNSTGSDMRSDEVNQEYNELVLEDQDQWL
ncbi:leucine-rich repeat domain-containing protein [Histomonas meleagridis]|uniref:leucine-rich repeat domain-containing protein n=1 Tax=Histomonas meleagridis TaxID=135588 RepID=UPI003559A4C6|nr:leucine-rich repeat domain-containing protein [Histomonas meleagridis]KAH0806097.1 leucine-rich repeat domain-containing protein [Histomonas meleagridis]